MTNGGAPSLSQHGSEHPSKPRSGGWAASWEGKAEYVFQALILALIFVHAFSLRLFSVLRYESVIHEFDPWFNYRTTRYMVSEGMYAFHNWFDANTWYPLGRFIGGTIYPGLMWTASALYHLAHSLGFTVDIRNVCVLVAPIFAGNTSIAAYLLTKESWNSHAGLFAAAFVSMVPGYVSRSVAGSYDNEAVAIFAMIFTFYVWVKAVKTGSILWGGLSALAYSYMVAAWGGYIFLINIIPLHALVLMLCGRYTRRLYIAYGAFYVVGTILSMHILFVGFIPVSSPEHLASFGVFGLMQLIEAVRGARALLSERQQKVLLRVAMVVIAALLVALVALALSGYVPALTGRFKSLIGSTSNIAIVHSVSEHQPTSWGTFFFDMHMLVFLAPAGLYFGFRSPNDGSIFLMLYLLTSAYFSGIMIRLVLVIAPAMCCLAGIAMSQVLATYSDIVTASGKDSRKLLPPRSDEAKRIDPNPEVPTTGSGYGVGGFRGGAGLLSVLGFVAVVSVLGGLCFLYVIHCTYVTQAAYSSPSIVLSANAGDGSKIIFDDFREAYNWLSHNTGDDAKIMSWWDYGYQITGMGNRTTIVDNNTRNNTHIATVGCAMASTERDAYPILRRLEVDYVLVVFGGLIGYSSDDINKFLWMVRISGGIFPRIVEADYYNSRGEYRMDRSASAVMRNSIMYKMSYYRFGEVQTDHRQPAGFDRVRHTEVGEKNIQLTHLEEAFTTEHWMVRIYRVKRPDELNRYG